MQIYISYIIETFWKYQRKAVFLKLPLLDSPTLFLTINSTLSLHNLSMEENQVPESTFVAAAGVWERLKQTFQLYKNNFVELTLLILFYNMIALVVSMGVWNQIVHFATKWQSTDFDIVSLFLSNTSMLATIIAIAIIGFLSYMIFFIPVFVGTLKSIRDAIAGKEVRVSENLKYGFSQFFNVLKVYWYVFEYVFLTPALLLIAWLVVILIATITGIESLFTVGGLLLVAALIVWIIYGVYRWLRSTFRLYGAIENEDFSKELFRRWLDETKGKLWRILGNFILIGIIVWLWSGILGSVISAVTGVDQDIYSENWLAYEEGEITESEILEMSQIDTLMFVHGIIMSIIESIWLVFVTIFTYVFYLRIRDEYGNHEQSWINEQVKEDEESL